MPRDGFVFGFWSAVAALVTAVGYAIPQLMQVAGILHDPWDRILIFAPSLLLAPSFVLAMVGLHAVTEPSKQVWTLAALSLAIMYAVLVSSVYVTQLGVVIPHDLKGDGARYQVFACCGANQFMTGVDLLGYTLMSVSTLFASPAFARTPIAKATRAAFIANGLLAPVLIPKVYFPKLIYLGALWLITFPLAMLLLAMLFRRTLRSVSA
jgi:hypothetical protein